MFLSSTTGPFLRPDLPDSTAPRTEAVKTGRRPPPQAAQCGLDGREHGVTLNQVGSARFLSRHPIRKAWLTDLPPARLPPAALFACQNGRKSHHPSRLRNRPEGFCIVMPLQMPSHHLAGLRSKAGLRPERVVDIETAGA